MKVGTGIEFDISSFLTQTPAQHVPQVLDFMKLKTKEELVNLIPPTTGQKRKINNFAILTLSLAESIQKTDMSPSAVLLALVEQIKVIAPNSTTVTNSSSSSSPSVTDALLKTMGTPYEDILRFVWASHHYPDEVTSPKTGNLQDDETLKWHQEITKKTIPNTTVDLTRIPLPKIHSVKMGQLRQ